MVEPCEFSDLVKQAFIDPIRSVLIVDDQYPTWEETLNQHRPEAERDNDLFARSNAKKWRSVPDAPAKVIEQFRKQKPALIIDIHDAVTNAPMEEPEHNENIHQEPATEQPQVVVPQHLHQSDLLILDYNLEGANTGLQGVMARSILSSILRNQHFNLVVIHTEEEDLRSVFSDCILSLHTPCGDQLSDKEKALLETLKTHLDGLADEEKFAASDLRGHFDVQAYLALRHPATNVSELFAQYMKDEGPLGPLGKWATALGLKGGMRRAFVFWAIERFETARYGLFSDEAFAGLKWSIDSERLWLRTSRGFVTFIKKEQNDLMYELQQSLIDWQPTPSRLISAKLRHEISCNGVEAEDRTLSRKHVFAHFYQQVHAVKSASERSKMLRNQLQRQMEALSFQIEDSIVEFGETINASDEKGGSTYQSHYSIDITLPNELKTAMMHFNSYVSTLPAKVEPDHLDCGHIFKLGEEWWVCATPACDLQPGQNSIAFVGKSKNLRPFTALRLHQINQELEASDINSGIFCFVESAPSQIVCLGLQQTAAPANSDKATWRTFVAKNDGSFIKNKIDLIVPKLTDDNIEHTDVTAEIITKLRYEYALNYVQKVGASVTRIGLGYVS